MVKRVGVTMPPEVMRKQGSTIQKMMSRKMKGQFHFKAGLAEKLLGLGGEHMGETSSSFFEKAGVTTAPEKEDTKKAGGKKAKEDPNEKLMTTAAAQKQARACETKLKKTKEVAEKLADNLAITWLAQVAMPALKESEVANFKANARHVIFGMLYLNLKKSSPGIAEKDMQKPMTEGLAVLFSSKKAEFHIPFPPRTFGQVPLRALVVPCVLAPSSFGRVRKLTFLKPLTAQTGSGPLIVRKHTLAAPAELVHGVPARRGGILGSPGRPAGGPFSCGNYYFSLCRLCLPAFLVLFGTRG